MDQHDIEITRQLTRMRRMDRQLMLQGITGAVIIAILAAFGRVMPPLVGWGLLGVWGLWVWYGHRTVSTFDVDAEHFAKSISDRS